ncbi:MAG: hypothetical protein LBV67_05155, partial [Streptococcaceae bacterium]|nr:hypothetical protein [Streptococcaceae bacterium]
MLDSGYSKNQLQINSIIKEGHFLGASNNDTNAKLIEIFESGELASICESKNIEKVAKFLITKGILQPQGVDGSAGEYERGFYT